MDQPLAAPFVLGDWSVDPQLYRLARAGETIKLEPRTMRLLQCLAARAGEVVSADDLLDQVWPGVIVTPDSVYQAVASLRRLLGDDPKAPRYIVTVPRQGYRMIATVGALPLPLADIEPSMAEAAAPPASNETALPDRKPTWRRVGPVAAFVAAVVIVAAIALGGFLHGRVDPAAATPDPRSLAVLPFLDLTESMGEEVFADGMTEELIDKLSQIPGLRVPAPTASFWFKDKQLGLAEIGSKLAVTYVVDGSVRKSADTMRVAARLVRASDGFVLWSATYDRPVGDRLKIQDTIAAEVRQALDARLRGTATAGP